MAGLDIFSEIEKACDFPYRIFVLQGTIDELNTIILEQREKFRRAAKLALKLLEAKKIPVMKSSGHVDQQLVKLSHQGYMILTQDAALKKKLVRPYLTIRQKKRIIVVG